MLDHDVFNDEDLSITVNGSVVKFSGSLEFSDPVVQFKPRLDKLNQEVMEKQMKKITVDLSELKYINSAGISVFVKWIIGLRELPENDRFGLNFVCNAEYKWQTQSVKMLSTIAPDIIAVNY